jgi:thiamine biosynthesis lipoprotein
VSRSRIGRLGAVAGAIGALIVALLALRALKSASEFRNYIGDAMATRWEVVLPERSGAAEAAEACFQLFRELDLELSEWREGSPLSAVNRAAGAEPVAVPQALFELVERSLAIGRETDGAFDVSWAALWGLWDFRAETPIVPREDEILERLELVDYRRVIADAGARTIFLPESGMKLGLGAIGKGYALDRAAELLEARGFTDFLLVGGGQVVARGRRDGRRWSIGLRDPRGAPDDLFARMTLDDGSLATSADNERFFEVGDVRYHHVLDPRTGRPTRGLRSATILHREALVADALSTAVMVLGVERGLEIVGKLEAEAVLVDDRGRIVVTPGVGERLERLREPRRR